MDFSALLQQLENRDPLFKYSVLSLENIGLNPFKMTKMGLLKRLIHVVSVVIPFILLFSSIIEQRGNVRHLNMDVYAPTQQILFKFLFILYLRKSVGRVLENIISSWPENIYGEKLQSKINETKYGYHQLFKKYRAIIWSTIFIYIIKAPISSYKVPLFVWYQPFEDDNRKLMVLNVLFQQYYIALAGYALLAYDALFFAMMSHCHTQFQAIKHGFEHLNYDYGEEAVYKTFSEIVRHHNFLLRMVNDINKIFSTQLLNHLFTVMVSICSGIFLLNEEGFPPSTEAILTYIPYLMSYHFQLYMYCAKGQEIAEQAESVSLSVYNSKWYLTHQRMLSKPIRMVMNITTMPNKLTIGGYWLLNLRTFMVLIKTSMSFNAFMHTVYKKN